MLNIETILKMKRIKKVLSTFPKFFINITIRLYQWYLIFKMLMLTYYDLPKLSPNIFLKLYYFKILIDFPFLTQGRILMRFYSWKRLRNNPHLIDIWAPINLDQCTFFNHNSLFQGFVNMGLWFKAIKSPHFIKDLLNELTFFICPFPPFRNMARFLPFIFYLKTLPSAYEDMSSATHILKPSFPLTIFTVNMDYLH